METIDFKKQLKQFYHASAQDIAEVTVPAMQFLMVDGTGDPNTSSEYADALEALFAVSYAAKFMLKKGPAAINYGVMPLEGLWWADDMRQFSIEDKSNWQWTMMIMQPEMVSKAIIEQAIAEVARKKAPAALSKLRLEQFVEGRSVQILHVGPFTTEGPTIARLHEYIEAHGRLAGKHHEIYLSDIRRANPATWKTIIRQPMNTRDL